MNVFSGAIALAVVIYAILYRAVNALDVLFALRGFAHHDLILSLFGALFFSLPFLTGFVKRRWIDEEIAKKPPFRRLYCSISNSSD